MSDPMLVQLFILCVIIATTAGKKDDAPTCPDGSHVEEKGTCYYYHSSPQSWGQASGQCRSQRGLLATFKNTGRARNILRDVVGLQDGTSTSLMWVGVSRGGDGQYRWTDGDVITSDWTNSITVDAGIQDGGCLTVDMQGVEQDNSFSLLLKNCSATSASYLCLVDPTQAVWTGWGEWGTCSLTCGTGQRKRFRQCVQSSADSSTSCDGDNTETDPCSPQTCPPLADYSWQAWGGWVTCSVTCGEGQKSRSRRCVDSMSGLEDPSQCEGGPQETDLCTNAACPDYQWEDWSKWTDCSVTCGGGQRSRSRPCVDKVTGAEDSSGCQGDSNETEDCNSDACVDYSWQAWGGWVTCSVTCGEGQKSRSRRCVDSMSGLEDPSQCEGGPQETDLCTNAACPDYQWEGWSKWTDCSVTCGGGQRSRSRPCVDKVTGAEDSSGCQGDSNETEDCNPDACVDYQWEGWSKWTDCSVTCGGGQRSRSRPCVDNVTGAEDSSRCQGDNNEKEDCNSNTCADYSWQAWGGWVTCSVTCGEGQKSRSRRCVDSMSGLEDPSQCEGGPQETDLCTNAACPDYDWQTWGGWSSCSATCGKGEMSRSRRCVDKVTGSEDSQQCKGQGQQDKPCNSDRCPEPEWQVWSQWSLCSRTCSLGSRSRSRQCTLAGAPASGCEGKDTATKTCVTNCKGLGKLDIVENIKPGLDAATAQKLENWARATQHVREKLFQAQNLRDYVISGHVRETHTVPACSVCVRECLALGEQCKSFNFQHTPDRSGNHLCQLNKVTRDEAINDLVKMEGFTVYEFSDYIPFLD